MAKGIDGPHTYTSGIQMQIPSQHSSSVGPAPAGSMREEQTSSGVPDVGMFDASYAAARGSSFNAWGTYTGPTMPGKLGNDPMFPSAEPHFSSTMPATEVTHVDGDMCAAYSWPDAPGGGLGNNPDGYEK
jgi:hypothetical protein